MGPASTTWSEAQAAHPNKASAQALGKSGFVAKPNASRVFAPSQVLLISLSEPLTNWKKLGKGSI